MTPAAPFNLAGRRALVTGSSRGIGRAIAIGLAEAGADVAVHCSSNLPAAEQVRDDIRRLGRKCGIIQADLAAPGAARSTFDQAVAILSRVDILVLNASVQYRHAYGEVTPEELDQQVTVNLCSVVEMIQCALPPMRSRGWGRVLMIGSVQERRPHPEMPIYAALKAATSNLVHNLAKQVAADGVTVNNLSPGVIDTDRNADALSDADSRERVVRKIPAQRVGQPHDCVGPALLLCSDAGSYITGIDLYVDGGLGLP